MATIYNITIGNDIARDAPCEIAMGNDVARDIHCDITMSNDIASCVHIMASQCIMMLLWKKILLYAWLCNFILLWVVWNKNKNKFMFDQSGLENTFVVFV